MGKKKPTRAAPPEPMGMAPPTPTGTGGTTTPPRAASNGNGHHLAMPAAAPPQSPAVGWRHARPDRSAPLLEITVSDSEIHGTSSNAVKNSVNAFVDYKVTTRTELPQYSANEFFVRRRYRDFVWLRQRLCSAFPGVIVPPLPEVDSLLTDDRFSSAFIQRRQAGLQLFLRRVAGHRQLARGADLQTFLEAKVWELQTAKDQKTSSWFSSMYDSAGDSVAEAARAVKAKFRTTKSPEEDAVESLRHFTSEYASVITNVASCHTGTVKSLQDMAADLGQLGPAFDLLSQTETELSLPFTEMAATLSTLREAALNRVQAEYVNGLSALLAFNRGMSLSVKEVCVSSLTHAHAMPPAAVPLPRTLPSHLPRLPRACSPDGRGGAHPHSPGCLPLDRLAALTSPVCRGAGADKPRHVPRAARGGVVGARREAGRAGQV